jgi:DNA-directed RNA polymerase subunit RPC12/RpoP
MFRSRNQKMPWRCPSCSTPITVRHEAEELPREGIVYLCYVCGLELVFDSKLQKLRPASPPDRPESNAA